MAKELLVSGAKSLNLYALIFDLHSQDYLPGTGFVAFDYTNWSTYAVAAAELGGAGNSGIYTADFPVAIVAPGEYSILVYSRSGGTPAVSDPPPLASGPFYWTGMAPTYPALQSGLDALKSELDLVYTKLSTAGTSIQVSGPVIAVDGSFSFEQGYDYLVSNASNFVLSLTGAPDLTGAVLTLIDPRSDQAYAFVVTAMTTGVGIQQIINVEISSTDTWKYGKGQTYPYALKAVIAGAALPPPLESTFSVLD